MPRSYRQAADVGRDTEVQRLAAQLYERFIRLISTKAGVARLKPWPGKLYRRFERGEFVPGTELDPSFTDLDVIVAHQPSEQNQHATANGYVDKDKQTGRFQLALVDHDVWEADFELPLEPRRARARFPRGTFVHELMHYLDLAHRWKGSEDPFDQETEEERRRQEQDEVELDSSYWNDPMEFNAYFQEGAERLNVEFEYALRHKAARRNQKLEWFTWPFYEFAGRARMYFRSEWLQHLNRRRQRAFIKRLYGLYSALHERAEDILQRSRVEPSDVRHLFGRGLDRQKLPKAPTPTVYTTNEATVMNPKLQQAIEELQQRVNMEMAPPRDKGGWTYAFSTTMPRDARRATSW